MEKLYSEEMEKYLLGCMLLNNNVIDDIQTIIRKEYFQFAKHSNIFETICSLYNTNKFCDLISLSQALPSLVGYIADLTSDIPSASNFEYYANQIKNFYTARRFSMFFKDKIQSVSNKNINETLQSCDDMINSCISDVGRIEPITNKQMAVDIVEDAQEAANNKGKFLGVSTGFELLDEKTGGMNLGDLVIIGARPSIGKSAFADQLNVNMGLNGEKTVLFSYEMSAKEIRTRRTSFLSNVYINKLKTGFFTSADIQKINNTCEKIFNTDMLLYDPANLNTFSFNELTALIRIHAKQGYKVFYIDHLGLLELPNEPYLQEYEKISRMTKTLKKLAATLNVCIISLCQLVRDSEGKEPMLNSLRGSGSIEQDANVVIFLHRDRQLKNEAAIPTKVIVAKNRNGGCGSIDFTFEPYTTRFREDNHDSEQNEEPVPIVYKPIKNTEKRAEQALF